MTGNLAQTSLLLLAVSAICLSLSAWLARDDPWWALQQRSCTTSEDGKAFSPESVVVEWKANDVVIVDLPAKVHFHSGPKIEAMISGHPELIRKVNLQNGRLQWDVGFDCTPAEDLAVQLTAPAVFAWELNGTSSLLLSQINQVALSITVRDHAIATIKGKAREVSVDLLERGNADLSELVTGVAKVRVKGRGTVDIAAQVEANISIRRREKLGSTGRPRRLNYDLSGRSEIIEMR